MQALDGALAGRATAGQIAVAVALPCGHGLLLWAGVVGAACFLVAISWLGVGAAGPTNLVLAAGVLLALRRVSPQTSTPGR